MKYILVVDDEADILETVVDTLEIEFGPDFKVECATNGAEALVKFDTVRVYDLIVTDLNMPVMGGIELTENIRKKYDQLPVIVFTGHGDLEEQQRLNSLGVKAMIKKPYVEDLIEEVCSSLSLKTQS